MAMEMVRVGVWQEPYEAREQQAWLWILFDFVTGVENLYWILQIPPLLYYLAKTFDLTQECLNGSTSPAMASPTMGWDLSHY